MLFMQLIAAIVLGVALGGLGLIALADRAAGPALPFGPDADFNPHGLTPHGDQP